MLRQCSRALAVSLLVCSLAGAAVGGEDPAQRARPKRERAEFLQGVQLDARGKHCEAAQHFEDFCSAYPDSEHIEDALYNQALSLEACGSPEHALGAIDAYLLAYPQGRHAPSFWFRSAAAHEENGRLEEALHAYESLVALFPKSELAPVAVFNAAVVHDALAQHELAARVFESYAAEWSATGEAVSALLLAAEQWEHVDTARARTLYRRAIHATAEQDPITALHARARLASLLVNLDKFEDASVHWPVLERGQQALLAQGVSAPVEVMEALALREFQSLWVSYQTFREVSFRDGLEANILLLTETKPQELADLSEAVRAFLLEHRYFTATSAALYVRAAAHFDYDAMLSSCPPPDLPESAVELWRSDIERLARPVRQKAKMFAQGVGSYGQRSDSWSLWQDRARSLLEEHTSAGPAEPLQAGPEQSPDPRKGARDWAASPSP